MIVQKGSVDYDLTPPHDILDRKIEEYLPKGQGADFIEKMMRDSYKLLSEHPVNLKGLRMEKILETQFGFGGREENLD